MSVAIPFLGGGGVSEEVKTLAEALPPLNYLLPRTVKNYSVIPPPRVSGSALEGKKEEGEEKGGEKKNALLGTNSGPPAWYVGHNSNCSSYCCRLACVACTIIPTYMANLNCHELRVALLATLTPPIIEY